MLPQFSIRNFFVGIMAIGFMIGALVSPNEFWESAVATVLGCAILIMVVVAIGSHERLRVQSIAFVAVCLVLLTLPNNRNDKNVRFRMPLHSFTKQVVDVLKTGDPQRSPNDEYVISNQSVGQFVLHFGRQSRAISELEIKQMKLSAFVYDSRSVVDSDKLYSIVNDFTIVALGCVGFLVSGLVFDRRPIGSSDP